VVCAEICTRQLIHVLLPSTLGTSMDNAVEAFWRLLRTCALSQIHKPKHHKCARRLISRGWSGPQHHKSPESPMVSEVVATPLK
jgi:hypothetical protein